MKKNISAYVLAVLTVCMLTVIGCKKEDDNDGKPISCITSSSSVAVGTSITFTSCSENGETYLWDFGVNGTTADVSTAQNPSYTYTAAGTYTVTLLVTNAKGSATSTKTITVTNGGGGTATAADYAGTYNVTTTCGSSYQIVVTVSGSTITINNFNNNSGGGVDAYVTGTANGNTLTLPAQNINPTPAAIAATTGTLSADKKTLTISYVVSEGGSSLNCTATAVKP